jgi:hypothetical protein
MDLKYADILHFLCLESPYKVIMNEEQKIEQKLDFLLRSDAMGCVNNQVSQSVEYYTCDV